jgi:hypothetical protein
MADVSALATANQVTLVIDTVNGIIDTLQNLQAWIPLAADIYTYFIAGSNEDAFKANIAGLATTADLVVIVDTVNGIIDTLQNLQNWIPTAAAIYTYFTTGSNEDIFKADITQVPDSATLSRMMHRIVWGIAQGVGDDSTTLAQRLITVASMAGAVARQIADSVLNDSLALQGAASGLTAGEIATAVNDTLGAYHGAASWLTGGIGTGPNDLTIFTIDTSQTPDDTLSSILTIVDNLTGTLEASGLTLSDGAFTAKLSLGSWLLSAGLNSSRWAFDDIPFTVTLPFDTVAILGYEVVVPSPTDPAKANVYGDVSDIMGNPIPGIVVKIELERTMNVTSPAPGALFATAAYDTTDATGRFSREIVRSTVYGTTPADSVRSLYHVTGTYNRRFTVFVIDSLYIPATGNVDLTQAIRDRY